MSDFLSFAGDRVTRLVAQHSDLQDRIAPFIEPEQILTHRIADPEVSMTRVLWSTQNGPAKGGIRISATSDEAALKALAIRILLKCTANHLPHGGAAGEIVLDKKNCSDEDLNAAIINFIEMNKTNLTNNKDILSPDLGFGEAEIRLAVDYVKSQTEVPAHQINGKPRELGGVPGRKDATGVGGAHVLDRVCEYSSLRFAARTFAMQGFGHAGQGVAKQLNRRGWTCVSLSDSTATLYAPSGLDIARLIELKSHSLSFADIEDDAIDVLKHEDQFRLDAELFIPAFSADAVTAKRAETMRCHAILEIANSPVSGDADSILKEKGVTVIPDLVANAGGIIASHLEWSYGKSDEPPPASEEAIFEAVKDRMDVSVKSMMETATARKVSLPEAANIISIEHLSL